jgi:hypothetical protein
MNRTALAWSLVFGLTASALLSTSARADDEVGAKPVALNLGTDAASIVAAADASPAAAGPDAAAAASTQVSLGFASNPRATNSLLGNGQLGRLLGISPDSGVTIGGNVFTGGRQAPTADRCRSASGSPGRILREKPARRSMGI